MAAESWRAACPAADSFQLRESFGDRIAGARSTGRAAAAAATRDPRRVDALATFAAAPRSGGDAGGDASDGPAAFAAINRALLDASDGGSDATAAGFVAAARRACALEVYRVRRVRALTARIETSVLALDAAASPDSPASDRAPHAPSASARRDAAELFTQWAVAALNERDEAREPDAADVAREEATEAPSQGLAAKERTKAGAAKAPRKAAARAAFLAAQAAAAETADPLIPWLDANAAAVAAAAASSIDNNNNNGASSSGALVFQRLLAAAGGDATAARRVFADIARWAAAARAEVAAAAARLRAGDDRAGAVFVRVRRVVGVFAQRADAEAAVVEVWRPAGGAPEASAGTDDDNDAAGADDGDNASDGTSPVLLFSCPLLPAYLEKLRRLYVPFRTQQQTGAAVADSNDGNDDDSSTDAEQAFLCRVAAVLGRYYALAGASPAACDHNAGFHAAVPPAVALAERAALGGAVVECFASPLNTGTRHFCSLFPDTDAWFGSAGSFFAVPAAALAAGAFHANPPFVPRVALRVARRVAAALKAADAASTASSFFVVVHHNDEAKMAAALAAFQGPMLRRWRVLPAAAATFVDGHQHVLDRPCFQLRGGTHAMLLQSAAAVAATPPGAAFDAVVAAWAEASVPGGGGGGGAAAAEGAAGRKRGRAEGSVGDEAQRARPRPAEPRGASSVGAISGGRFAALRRR